LRLRCMQTGRGGDMVDPEEVKRGHNGNVQPALVLPGIVGREDVVGEFD
jgi:hypothetical protein